MRERHKRKEMTYGEVAEASFAEWRRVGLLTRLVLSWLFFLKKNISFYVVVGWEVKIAVCFSRIVLNAATWIFQFGACAAYLVFCATNMQKVPEKNRPLFSSFFCF